jgi:hypothetical protein
MLDDVKMVNRGLGILLVVGIEKAVLASRAGLGFHPAAVDSQIKVGHFSV